MNSIVMNTKYNTKQMISNPILYRIFVLDSTFRTVWEKVMIQISNITWRNRRLDKEVQRMMWDGFHILRYNPLSMHIHYHDKTYRMRISPEYPFCPPVVFIGQKKLDELEWQPTATIQSLLFSYHVYHDPSFCSKNCSMDS